MSDACRNCGRKGTLEHVTDVVLSRKPTEVRYGDDHAEETTDATILNVTRCTGCEAPSLATYHYIDGWSDPTDFMGLALLYPPHRETDDLPDRVRWRYEKMLELLHAPDAFAVRAGRLLEAICADQGLPEGDLGPRLDQLAGKKRNTIPKALGEQAHLVRRFRNLGGHDDDVEVEAGDLPLIRNFVEALLEFLYWGPAKLERGRQDLDRRLMAARGDDL
jgi:hypothetical protein